MEFLHWRHFRAQPRNTNLEISSNYFNFSMVSSGATTTPHISQRSSLFPPWSCVLHCTHKWSTSLSHCPQDWSVDCSEQADALIAHRNENQTYPTTTACNRVHAFHPPTTPGSYVSVLSAFQHCIVFCFLPYASSMFPPFATLGLYVCTYFAAGGMRERFENGCNVYRG